MLMSVFNLLADAASDIKALQDQVKLDSQILAETFYFWTVVVMWLIHAGFMAYEAGAARRKNVMSTAMKNILTIAVVTPTFYYFGWYVYGCMEEGWPKSGHASPDAFPGFCGLTAPWSAASGPNLTDHISGVFFLAFLLFSWTTGSIMSGALIERIRLSAYLILTVLLGSFVWILDAAWGWSAGGWLTHALRLPRRDRLRRRARRRRHLHARRADQPRATHREVRHQGQSAGPSEATTSTSPCSGLMLIFTGFYGFYAACLVIQSTVFPGWLNIYLSPTTLGAIAMVITIGFAGGFTGGWFASKGDPFWTLSGGLAGVIAVSAGADVYHPSLAYLLSFSGAVARRLGGQVHRGAAPARRRGRCGRGARRLRLLRRAARRDLRRRLPDRDQQRRDVARRPADRDHDVHPARLPARVLREPRCSRS